MNENVVNMKITRTSITMEDHGCLTFYIYLEGASTGVCYGGYNIGRGYLGADKFEGFGQGLEAMMHIMDVVGVEKWEDLPGKYVRMVDPGLGGIVNTIGNIIQDKWFNIKEFFSEVN